METISPPVSVIRATLTLPPGINRTYKPGKSRIQCTEEAKAWKQQAYYELYQQLGPTKLSKKFMYTLCMNFHFKYLLVGDEDRSIKMTQDVLFDFVGVNDNRVKRLEVEKFEDRIYQRCEITLSTNSNITSKVVESSTRFLQIER